MPTGTMSVPGKETQAELGPCPKHAASLSGHSSLLLLRVNHVRDPVDEVQVSFWLIYFVVGAYGFSLWNI